MLDDIISKIEEYAPNANFDLVKKAYNFSKDSHKGQLRKSGEEYFIHPKEVAMILAKLEMDADTIAAGLLHDVIEDTRYTYEDIKIMFSPEVAHLVEGVTKLGKISYKSKEETQAENLRKMFLAMGKDIRVILIKLADRLHNMRTLNYMSEAKAKEKARECLEIYAPIAHRLGISKIKSELEDISLRYLDPEGYYDLREKVSKKKKEREAFIQKVIDILKVKFEELSIDCNIYGRAKHFYSIYRKMHYQNKEFEEIYDLTAVRAIVPSVRECYAVLGIVHTIWKPIPGRFKDYIAMPKPNMYQSLHTTVVGPDGEPIEIQIRTEEMHKTAEYGIAAHWKYKEGKTQEQEQEEENSEDMEKKLVWLRQMMEWQKDLNDPKEFMEALKIELFTNQVFVFSPKADVVELPAGSTPVDFAYKVHTAVGNRCIGAKVDGRIVPLDYKLKNGNIVEIITSSHTNGPSRDWLNLVKSSQAKNKIRQWFKKERKHENLERGKHMLEKEVKRLALPVGIVLKHKFVTEIAKKFNQNTEEDFYATIGYGGLTLSQIIPKIKEKYEKEYKKNVKENNEIKEKQDNIVEVKEIDNKKNENKNRGQGVVIRGIDNVLVRFAKCCNPLPGDGIIGYITQGRGISIHRKDCQNILGDDANTKNRLIEVSWNTDKKVSFEAEVQVKANDRRGLITEVTQVFAESKISLNGINARTNKNKIANMNLFIEVNSIEQLNSIMNRLNSIPGVLDVYRVIN